jgi:AcrR family transcriptional regulator
MRIDNVLEASGSSRAKLYHCFPDRGAVVDAAVAYLIAELLGAQEAMLADLDTLDGLQVWARAVSEASSDGQGVGVGLLVSELADHSEELRQRLDQALQVWAGYLAASLGRMQDHGELAADANPGMLAVGLLAALQGGLVLAKTARDASRMRAAMDMALAQVAAAAPPSATESRPA